MRFPRSCTIRSLDPLAVLGRARHARSTPRARIRIAGIASGALLAATGWFLPAPSGAESSIRLPAIGDTHEVAATTFDPGGKAVGKSRFWVEALANGRQKLSVELGVDSGGRNLSQVTLGPASAGQSASGAASGLQILEERSQSTRADGQRLDLLVIDHTNGRARCVPDAGGEAKARHIALPNPDRVVNVPMQLLFEPLVKGRVDEVRFQIVLCGEGPKLQDMIAVRGPRHRKADREVLEIRYGPDFGKAVAFLASRVLPSFSFWFDAATGEYLGHRMPLHSKGPEVVLIRSGLSPIDLGLR